MTVERWPQSSSSSSSTSSTRSRWYSYLSSNMAMTTMTMTLWQVFDSLGSVYGVWCVPVLRSFFLRSSHEYIYIYTVRTRTRPLSRTYVYLSLLFFFPSFVFAALFPPFHPVRSLPTTNTITIMLVPLFLPTDFLLFVVSPTDGRGKAFLSFLSTLPVIEALDVFNENATHLQTQMILHAHAPHRFDHTYIRYIPARENTQPHHFIHPVKQVGTVSVITISLSLSFRYRWNDRWPPSLMSWFLFLSCVRAVCVTFLLITFYFNSTQLQCKG